jgi:predicted helicase
MNALHYKAAFWVGHGIFDGLASFTEFESRVNEIIEEKDRGDVFEVFIEGYLATQAITQHTEHWVVGGIPVEMRERFNLPKDGTGIDGIYEERGGNQVAYQVKYRKNHNLTFAEVAPFLGITEKFTDRVIFTNASSLSDKAAVRTRWYSGEVFNALTSVQFEQIEAWLKEKPAPVARAIPDPRYQTQVLTDIATTLKDNARATVVMACGTGKTLVALWATEQAKPRTVLVLLPSLMLLQQTLREWSQQTSWGSRFSYLCVFRQDRRLEE